MTTKAVHQRRVVVQNERGEKLIGVLHDTASKELAIVCHGFRSSKDRNPMANLAATISSTKGLSAFRFDFAGNGESEGDFQYGNYRREAEDLRSVIQHFRKEERTIASIIGHSKGGNAVLLYAAMYQDVRSVINIAGRFNLKEGIEGRLGQRYMERIKQDGCIDVRNREGQFLYRVTEDSLMDRLSTDTRGACSMIGKECRVLTIHGSEDETVPLKDAFEFGSVIGSHEIRVVEGADHHFSSHQGRLSSLVLEFLNDISPKCRLCNQIVISKL